jgi:hypothetical protein
MERYMDPGRENACRLMERSVLDYDETEDK